MGIGLSALRRLGRDRRARWTAGGLVVVVGVLASTTAYALTGESRSPEAPTTVRVDRGDVTLAVATTGALQPAQTRSLSFGTAGTVSEVRVRAGDEVQAGQVLALIDATDARDRVDSAQQALDKAEAALDTAEASQDDQSVDTCPVAASGGGAAVVLAVAPTTVPASPTPASSATPTQSPRPTVSPTPTAKPSPAGPTPTRDPAGQPGRSGPSAPGGDSGATCPSRGGQSGAGQSGATGTDPVLRAQQQLTSARLAVAEAEEALAGTTITAPLAGKVLSVAGAVGGRVSDGGTFITLGDVAGMAVSAKFPEADAGRLAVGLAATVTLADRPGEEFAATVSQVDPVGTTDGQMVRYGALLDFVDVPTGTLVGQSANVRVKIQSVSGVLRVPVTAVGAITGDAGTVLLRTAVGTESRQVTVGVRGDQYTEITAGLAEGDQVVVNG
ncbi:efflux RND transporter periplasmic adaptor subunit [Micromonospora chaiyaphumensis]|uniref:HlyD family secretion protein n=1 Tax=Micromonospora chaiyaphumensis TaxID=307119 RepID=A0A1C4VLZ9_9ACTN|nr:efflux RND transporter periplasmic adaptor subunit [Micromonospora chaiyaphumensis]SCE84983.1 HlyD family secretion protein [Micromonospora chaiyaphumensis]